MTTIEFTPTPTATPPATPTTTLAPLSNPATVRVDRGWHDDPFDQHELRFHDGSEWTEHVTHFGPVPCRGCHPYAR